MATGQLSPYPKLQFFDDDGAVAAGHLLFSYEAGTTTKLSTYTNDTLTVLNTNPIVLDSSGRCTVFLADDDYKFVLAEPTDTDPPTSPLWTVDGVRAVPASAANIDISGTAGETIAQYEVVYLSDGSGALTAGRWYLASSDHNYASVDAPSIGIAQIAASAAGSTFTVRVYGKSTVSGALSSGSTYYVGSTAGTLSASSTQQNREPFGQADSTTTIIFPIGGTISISIKHALKTFGFSAGQGNSSTSGTDTELTSYALTVPDNFLDQPGASLVIEGLLVKAANADTVTMKIAIGGSGLLTVFTNAQNVVNHRIPFRINMIRRASDAAAITGLFYHGAAHTGAPTVYLANHALSGTIDWTAAQALKIYLASDTGGAANDVYLTDLRISQERSPYGTLV